MTPLVKDRNLYQNVRFSRDGSTVVYSDVGRRSSGGSVCRRTRHFSNARKLTDLNPWMARKALPASELVAYRDADGKVLYGVLRYPVGYQKGRRVSDGVRDLRDVLRERLQRARGVPRQHGYAVFHPSVNLVVGRPGESWAKGVTAAANKLIDMGVADPDRLGVHGTSYGGYATVLLITETDRFKAAINVSGKVNMVSFYTDSPRLGVRNTHAPEKSQDRIGGTLWEYPERYLEHSAIMRRGSHQDAAAEHHRRSGSQRAGEPVARDLLRAASARSGRRVGALREWRPPAAEQRRARSSTSRIGFSPGTTSI